jgi:hypothetical protein
MYIHREIRRIKRIIKLRSEKVLLRSLLLKRGVMGMRIRMKRERHKRLYAYTYRHMTKSTNRTPQVHGQNSGEPIHVLMI